MAKHRSGTLKKTSWSSSKHLLPDPQTSTVSIVLQTFDAPLHADTASRDMQSAFTFGELYDEHWILTLYVLQREFLDRHRNES
jgi:hypothetical protein